MYLSSTRSGVSMKVEIYGMGCANCNALEEIAKEAVRETGVCAEVVKVDDMIQIIESGILATPGLAIDGRVRSMGRVPSKAEIVAWITEKK
jgi:small redox-active disulfide protein 2